MTAMRLRTLASYALLIAAVLPLLAAPLVLVRDVSMVSVCFALTLMFAGGAWLVMAPEAGAESGRPLRLFFGRLLFSAGVVLAGLFGAGVLYLWLEFIPPVLTRTVHQPRFFAPDTLLGAIMWPLTIGLIPILIGVALAVVGRVLIRSFRREHPA
ncbi:MAG TPA: hypothetical protein VG407_11830 [Caulobacteraceae bacterium]|jgi:hypothetical protein|nr:hypothetical protein [Caulobacteraceae bacterium]